MERITTGKMETRRVYQDGKWITVTIDMGQLRSDISSLNEIQRNILGKRIITRREIDDDDVQAVFTKYENQMGDMLKIITELKNRYVSTTNNDLKYECKTNEGRFGTSTTFADAVNAEVAYLWGAPEKQPDLPDLQQVTAETVMAFAKPTETGYDAVTISKAESLKHYFPKNAIVGRHAVNAAKKAKSREEALGNITDMLNDKEGSKVVVKDIVESQPRMLSYGKKKSVLKHIQVGDITYIRKGPPTCVDVTKTPFSTLVQMLDIMSSAFGTKKYGFGKLSQSSYDGLSNLEGAARERHENITDFISEPKVEVYLIRTRDVVMARAMYREISKSRGDDKFIVVFDGIHTDSGLLKQMCALEKRVATKILAAGVVCVSAMSWQTTFANLGTYYISWKSYKKGKGKDDELLSSSYANRMYDEECAKIYTYYAYYGFIGAMGETDFAVPSCKGKSGTVIFTNARKGYNRTTMGNIVYNIMHHALLYPWLNSPYMYKVSEKFFFAGVRDFKTNYDFTVKSKYDKFLCSEVEDDSLSVDDIERFYEDLQKEYGAVTNEKMQQYHEAHVELIARQTKRNVTSSPNEKEEEEDIEEETPTLDEDDDLLAQSFAAAKGAEENT